MKIMLEKVPVVEITEREKAVHEPIAIAVKQGKYVGLLQAGEGSKKSIRSVRHIPALSQDSFTLAELWNVYRMGVSYVPFVNHQGEPQGVLPLSKALQLLDEKSLRVPIPPEFLRKPVTLSSDATIAQARALFKKERCEYLVIIREHSKEIVGVLPQREVILDVPKEKRPFMREKKTPHELPLLSLVKNTAVIPITATMEEARNALLTTDTVVCTHKDGSPAGLMTRFDIVSFLTKGERISKVRIEKIDAETRHELETIQKLAEKFAEKIDVFVSEISLSFKKEKGAFHIRARVRLAAQRKPLYEEVTAYRIHEGLSLLFETLKHRIVKEHRFIQQRRKGKV